MNNKYYNSYEDTKELLNILRESNTKQMVDSAFNKRKKMLKEDKDSSSKKDFIAITNEPRFGTNVLQSQIDAFKNSVNPGAKFSDENSEDPENNPLIYLPKTGNLIFSGTIPNLNNLKFQFSLMDITDAPYIWANGLPLTSEVIETINKLNGFFQNWKEQWLLREDLLQKLDKESKK